MRLLKYRLDLEYIQSLGVTLVNQAAVAKDKNGIYRTDIDR